MGWFLWFIIGFVLGGSTIWLVRELDSRNLKLRWYEWVLSALGLLTLILAIQTFVGSLAEGQSQAAWLGLVTLLVPTAIFAAAAARLVQVRVKKA